MIKGTKTETEAGAVNLLYAEDERAMSEAVVDILTYHNYLVDAVEDGEEALSYARAGRYDGIILDIMMPRRSGIEVLESLRREGDTTPILLLTAKTEVEDRIAGLDAGADDYLPKPFAMGELLARVRAMLRRRGEPFTALRCGGLTLDPRTAMLCCGGKSVSLSRLEYRMMECFLCHQGMCLTTDTLLEQVWGNETDAERGAVWVYVSYLRKKLSRLDAQVSITARRGVGYTLECGEKSDTSDGPGDAP